MSLSPRLIAIQGIGFTPIEMAVQGLLDYYASGKHLHQDTDQGRAGKGAGKDYAAENLRRQFEQQQKALQEKEAKEYNQKRLQLDDMLATEFIMALVQTELLDGTI